MLIHHVAICLLLSEVLLAEVTTASGSALNGAVSFSWSEVAQGLDLSLYLQSVVNSPTLVLAANALVPGESYRFQLVVTFVPSSGLMQTGVAAISIQVCLVSLNTPI